MDEPAQQLGYGRKRRRRRWPWALFAIAVLAAVAWSNPARFRVWRLRLEFVYWEHQCATFSLPPETVVYEEDPARAAALLARRDVYSTVTDGSERPFSWLPGYPTPAGYDPPTCARKIWNPPFQTVFFLHELRPRAGPPRLVVVEAFLRDVMSAHSARELVLWARSAPMGASQFYVARDAHSYASSAVWGVEQVRLEADDVLRMFAGQCVPDDPSSFEFRYELNGAPGVLRATLLDNGEFKWKVISGKMRLLSEHPLAPHPRVKKGVVIEG